MSCRDEVLGKDKVGLVDPGLEVVRHEPGRDAAEERERLHVAPGPGTLVHRQDRADEHVPRAGLLPLIQMPLA
jgi:hypothetical protein